MPNEPLLGRRAGLSGLVADLGGLGQGWMTTRHGGVSSAPWDSLNLGDHLGDDAAAVLSNRARLQSAIGRRPVYLRQVHGVTVRRLDRTSPDGLQADGCWSDDPLIACVVLVADCLPLLFAAPDGSVAAVHAGWRGLAGEGGFGVLESLCEHWPAAHSSAQRADIHVWLGAAIGVDAFVVGADVWHAFVDHDASDRVAFTPVDGQRERWHANLAALARRRLQRLGFVHVHGNDGSVAWCTAQQPAWFFSHRRDSRLVGSTGRMAAAVWCGA
jgi:YfiH family protein